jgi:hypothetical protein
MDRLDPSNAEDAEHIHAVILSDDVSDGDSIDDGTESDEDYAEPSEREEDSTPDVYCFKEVDTTYNSFIGKNKTKCGKVKSTTHIRRMWQNIMTKLPGVIGQARKVAAPFEAWNCLIVDEILDSVV